MSAPAAPQDIVDAEAVIPEVIEQGGIDRHVVEALGVAIGLIRREYPGAFSLPGNQPSPGND